MTTITEKQYNSLKLAIYTLLLCGPEFERGDIGNSIDASKSTVDEWMKKEEITICEGNQPSNVSLKDQLWEAWKDCSKLY